MNAFTPPGGKVAGRPIGSLSGSRARAASPAPVERAQPDAVDRQPTAAVLTPPTFVPVSGHPSTVPASSHLANSHLATNLAPTARHLATGRAGDPSQQTSPQHYLPARPIAAQPARGDHRGARDVPRPNPGLHTTLRAFVQPASTPVSASARQAAGDARRSAVDPQPAPQPWPDLHNIGFRSSGTEMDGLHFNGAGSPAFDAIPSTKETFRNDGHAQELAQPAAFAVYESPGERRPPAERRVAEQQPAISAERAPQPRAPLGAGEPDPPLEQRLVNGFGKSRMEDKRISPRSPRTALEPENVPMPTRKSKRARHPLVIVGNAILTFFVLLAVVVGFTLLAGKERFDQAGPLTQDKVVNIAPKSGVRDIADQLEREGVIDQPKVFIGSVIVMKVRDDLKAGEYQFRAHASLREVVSTMIEGKVVQHQFTMPEGLTSEQIVAKLVDTDGLSGNIREIPREGSLLPETYRFTRGTTREQMIQRMQAAQRKVLDEVWERRTDGLPLKTPQDLVTLASIVEKETGRTDERTRVAAVFVNRLKQKMKLQSDPTIIYGLVGGRGALGRPIMKSEIEQATPYNTYVIPGLPPGPIANPGRASIEAAANPARTRELYFVADGTGGHTFSDSYDQHRKGVSNLREKEQSGTGAANAAADADDDAPTEATKPAPRRPARKR